MSGAFSGKRLAASPWLLMAPVLILLTAGYLLPLGQALIMSVSDPTWGVQHYMRIFQSPVFGEIILRTFKTAFVVTVLALLVAYPMAYVASLGSKTLAVVILGAVMLSYWTSFLVRTYAWMVILGNKGPITAALLALGWEPAPKLLYTTFSATVAMTHSLVPMMVLALVAVMRGINRQYSLAAESLGAHPIKAFLLIYLPLSAPGIVNGCTLVFITCLGFYAMPVLLGSPQDRMISGVIGDQIDQALNFGLGAAVSVVLLVITLVLYAIYSRFFSLDRLWSGGR